jgi:HEAT repeat protein
MNVKNISATSKLAVVVSLLALSSMLTEISAQNNKPAHGSLIALEVKAEWPRVSFGFDEGLKIKVTLQNRGNVPISFPAGSLNLKCNGWSGWSGNGSGFGTEILLTNEKRRKPIEIAAGDTVSFSVTDTDISVLTIGQVRASYALHAGETIIPVAPNNKNSASVEFEIWPSRLMLLAWHARTDAERTRVRSAVSEILKQQAKQEQDKEWRDQYFFRNTISFLGGYGIPIFESLMQDDDPVVRQQAMLTLPQVVRAVAELNSFLNHVDEEKQRPGWASGLTIQDEKAAEAAFERLALAALNDPDSRVRVAAIYGLKNSQVAQALEPVKKLASDSDSGVRSAAQGFLSKFGNDPGAVDTIIDSLSDADAKVREEAINALEHSPEPPPLQSLKRAFQSAKQDVALRLIYLLFEQESADLPETLLGGFKSCTGEGRLAILTLIAGHTDRASLDLIKLGLRDSEAAVQRAALVRLLAFSEATAVPLLESYLKQAPESLHQLAQAVRSEIEKRSLFPFLSEASDNIASASETTFPSRNGTVPMVSPDGQWVAYVETGWGRPGGTGGMGRSNLLSLLHAVRVDGTDDRLISDMFLVNWLPDSKRIASARDGFAAICDLDSNVVTEFGQVMEEKWLKAYEKNGDWAKGEPRNQMGARMPHRKRIPDNEDYEFGEDAAFSPDGKWFGPIILKNEASFLSSNNQDFKIKLSDANGPRKGQAMWSPDGKYVVLMNLRGEGAAIINTQTRTARIVKDVNANEFNDSWDYRKGRWNPWSKDGVHLTFIRKGQVWMMKPDGSGQKQVTFDSTRKAFPVFSRDGKRIAYLAWQPDNRRHYTRSGPTDLWVSDIETGLAARVTAPSAGRINCLDWLDDYTLIFDRLGDREYIGYESSLKRLSLSHK